MSAIPIRFKSGIALAVLMSMAAAGLVFAQAHSDDAHAGPTMNYHEISDRLATGGHFVDGGATVIRDKGIEVVIDLRDKPPKGQEQKLATLGIEWVNIPVVWRDPQRVDFERFSEVMAEHGNRHVLVQCQANYRASAMTYLYRVTAEGVADDIAKKDLHAIWEPNGRWREYMDGILDERR